MPSWVQPLENEDGRIVLRYARTVDTVWQRDSATTHFEGRNYPSTARTNHITEEWTVSTMWDATTRSTAEAYLALLRSTALTADPRLELHVEPANGALIDAVVQAIDIPQSYGVASTEITVTYRRVA